MIIIPVGVPGSGKGTQAKLIQEKINITKISTGDIFRENIKNETELGKKVKKLLDAGEFAPDDLTIALVRDRIQYEDCKKGFILDGFPRNITQAKALDQILEDMNLSIDFIVDVYIDIEEMKKRLNGRWSCKAHDHTYHEIFKPPLTPGKCDIDGSELYQREDQTPEAVEERIKKFQTETEPMITWLSKRKNYIKIDGKQEIDKVFKDICYELDL